MPGSPGPETGWEPVEIAWGWLRRLWTGRALRMDGWGGAGRGGGAREGLDGLAEWRQDRVWEDGGSPWVISGGQRNGRAWSRGQMVSPRAPGGRWSESLAPRPCGVSLASSPTAQLHFPALPPASSLTSANRLISAPSLLICPRGIIRLRCDPLRRCRQRAPHYVQRQPGLGQ